MKSLTASPPRAGMTALTPVPATYAPNSVRHRTRRPRYAAATMLRHARDAMSSLHRWQPTASPSHCHRTAARWWTKTPIACPGVWSTLYVLSLDRARTVRVGRHEGIAVVGRRDERLLDRARADPANQVPHRARLVVRPRCARAAALHFWPWYSKPPRTIAVATAAASADGCATMKSLPPVSPTMRG